ncbi:MAG TPA: ATP-dependent DNA helicase [Patescibacteria group bacterium]|nr:ATP-dependent DNA helicase [Patescibacteria group bacterium]
MDKTSNLKLNKEQQDAIKFGDGPLLIIAGAGTGKTTVITERIKYLIFGKYAKPEEILALTFTEKAAREMEERIDVAMPYGYTQMWVMTFHSFCDRILRREALHIGLDPKYKLMTEAESIQLLRSNLFKLELNYFRPLGNPNKFLSGMLQHFSRLQDEDVSPSDYTSWVKAQKVKGKVKSENDKIELEKWEELAKAYKAYDELKTKEGLMDFGDVIVKTLKLFRDRKNILASYQKQFKYLLVDEFQDTNYAQNELAIMLSGKSKNINVVGDDDQSVYRFRGAAVSNILQFRKTFPKTKVIVLTKNYRSTQEILDRSHDLIEHNNPDRLEVVEKIDKRLMSQTGNPPLQNATADAVEFIHTDRVENESDQIAKKILELQKENKYQYKDFAILVRANNHSEPIMRALSRNGIPFQFLGPGRLFKQPEIIDLISFLKVLYDFTDSVSFYRLLSIDHFGITGREVAELGNYARKNHTSLFEAAEKIGSDRVTKLTELINKNLDKVKKESAGQLLYFFLEETGLLQKLLSPENAEAEKRAKNISKLFDKLKSYEADHEDASVTAIVDWLDLSMELGESPLAANEDWTEINAVNILTVHSAKGLEFPVVFLVNLVAQRFPSMERREQIPIPESLIKEVLPIGDFHLEEERRLFYVGMTRAKERLFLTAADYYGEGKREKKLSPFIFESLGNKVGESEKYSANVDQLTFLDYETKNIPEVIVASEKLHINYLSYSQIETFQTCPMHYKLRYIYSLPTPPSASQSFGTAMHATLKEFFEAVSKKEKPTDKLIYQLLNKNWISEGYKTKSHEREFMQKGKDYLVGFLKNNFDAKNLPIAMEQKFTLPLGDGLKIGGTVDRIDKLPDDSIEIIDYKTGATIPTQREVDKNLQLSFYALAATKIQDFPFGKKPEQIKLSLYYLDSQEKISTTRTAKQLDEAIKEIFKVREEIEKSDFKCSNHIFCQMGCEFSLFCKTD